MKLSSLILKLKKIALPPVITGAKAMIEILSFEDNKIKEFAKVPQYIEPVYAKEELYEMVRKYNVKDYKQDLYCFIKPDNYAA